MTIQVEERVAVEPEVSVKSVPEVLRHAAFLLEETGWTRDAYKDADGRHCLVGALAAVQGDDEGCQGWGAEDAIEHYLGVSAAEDWNDVEGRTAAEVTAALRAAADAYEART